MRNNDKVRGASPPREAFGYLDDWVPDARVDLQYAEATNFTGARVPGYHGRRAIVTREVGRALQAVQREARESGWGLLVWDAYRPQRAVDAFLRWKVEPCAPTLKQMYYPEYSKEDLFRQGLIMSPSAHSRGSTVDLTLARVEEASSAERSTLALSLLDTGGRFDLFSPSSATDYRGLTVDQRRNRQYFCDLMSRHGFENLAKEWWHYTLRDEPFPDTYFDFEVRDDWPELSR